MTADVHTSRRVVADTCPLCGCSTGTPVAAWSADGCEWMRCVCTAVFKRSEPADADARADAIGHYDRDYFERYARRRRRRIAKSRVQILDVLEAAPRGRLLDVGCSLGYTLEAARSLGLDAAGVDLAPHAIEECHRLGFEARIGTLTELPFDDAAFGLVVLKHVFEHTARPREALAELRRVLAPGGAAFFAVPNVDYRRAAASPATSRFYRGEAGRAHYVYYSPRTLGRLLEEEGFRVASVHPVPLHRKATLARKMLEALALPLRLPARAVADGLALRKEFWLVAVRS
jgi:SAM-dependent methyltransferase